MSLAPGLTLISTQTATNQSSLAIVPASTYDMYLLVGNSVLNSTTTGTSMVAQISTNGGSSYINTGYGNSDIGLQVGFLDGGSSQLNFSAYLMNSRSSSSYVGSISSSLRTAFGSGDTYGDSYTVANTTANAFKIASGDGTNFSGVFSLYGILDQLVTPSASTASRSLNTAYQVSATRNAFVFYSVDISCTSTLLGGQSGTVYLEICPTSGFSSGVQTLTSFSNTNTVTIAIAITVNQVNTADVSGFVPAGYYVRLRSANNTGTPTFTYRSGQEVLL